MSMPKRGFHHYVPNLYFPKKTGSQTNLDATFSALSNPTRRAILEELTNGESSVTELARPFDMSLPAISKHLGILEKAGLLTREKAGRIHRCRIDATPLITAASWIAKYRPVWEKQLDTLAEYLDSTKSGKAK